MKRILYLIAAALLLLCLGLGTIQLVIGRDVKENIHLAVQKYPGSAEDALIAFLKDESNPALERTHVAIWTLGRLHSEKALPLLKELYQGDPKGENCFGRHVEMLCQYEIHKAIKSIQKRGLINYSRLIE